MATLEDVLGRSTTHSRDLRAIVDRIRPSVETLVTGRESADPDVLMADAVRANVRASANHLRHGSELLERLIRQEGLLVVGGEYSLESGVVTFFDGAPRTG
jgi:carbonic anhydrase